MGSVADFAADEVKKVEEMNEEVKEEVTEKVEVSEEVEDASVEKTMEVNEEPGVEDVVVEKTMEVIEETDVQEVEDVAVERTVEVDVEEVEVKVADEVEGQGVGDEKEGNGEGVAAEIPAQTRRKLPTLKRFSARRSAVAEDVGLADAAGPDAIRRQRGRSRKGMGVDDRDTVDYTRPKPEVEVVVAPRRGDPAARKGMLIDDRDTVDYIEPKPEEEVVVEEVMVTRKTTAMLSVAEREQLRLHNIKRNKKFECVERVRGKMVDVTAGLELHTGVFSRVEQQKLVDLVRELQEKGRRNELKERTYSEPRKWMRGKGRVTLQFGCCYNYAVDKNGNPPGILRDDVVDPIPPLLRTTIKRLVRWHVLPPTCVPDSCIINIYEEGDCIPPHIDHHDFLRPFCTLSLLSECNIVFGANLEILGPGDFGGSMALPLPVGSVLVLNGNGADVAKHAVPAVPTERMSITFRKMDPAKVPKGFTIDNDLQNLRPVVLQDS